MKKLIEELRGKLEKIEVERKGEIEEKSKELKRLMEERSEISIEMEREMESEIGVMNV